MGNNLWQIFFSCQNILCKLCYLEPISPHSLYDLETITIFYTGCIILLAAVYTTYKYSRNIFYGRLSWLFGLFVILCGTGYLSNIINTSYSVSWIRHGGLGCIAVIAVCMAFELLKQLPQLKSLKSLSELTKINQQLQAENQHRRHIQTAFQSLVTCTSVSTGEEYFSKLVMSLAMVLNVETVVVTERANPDSLNLRILALWHHEQHPIDSKFAALQTPCAQVIKTAKVHYEPNLKIPSTHPMAQLATNTYLGAPLLDEAGQVMGTLFILHNGALKELKLAKLFLQVFSTRSAAELKRHQLERELRSAYSNLELRIQQRTEELQKAKDAAEAANHSKSIFLGQVSHELRTPLNAVLGFTELVSQDRTLSADHRESLEIIEASGSHLLDLINNILVITKLENNYTCLQTSNVDVNKLVYELVGMVQFKAKRRGLKLKLERDLNILHYVTIDVSKLRQIILNLLDNAIKYTDSGEILLRTYPVLQRGSIQLGIAISDTGPGISESEQQKIFAPFYQSHQASTIHDANQQGVGLGLAICQGLIKLMGGTIRCQSQLGRGTTFYVELPVKIMQSLPQPSQLPVIPTHYSTPPNHHYKILVVEDSPTNRLLLRRILKDAGFIVHEAKNGQQAIEKWQSCQPDLILMDIQMPVMNGYDATAYIKQQDPKLPIIALTASTLEFELNEILSVGCNSFIYKPFKREQLLQIINQYLVNSVHAIDSTPRNIQISV